MLTSSSLTNSRRCILALASDMRIMLSMWRTAIGMPPAITEVSIAISVKQMRENSESGRQTTGHKPVAAATTHKACSNIRADLIGNAFEHQRQYNQHTNNTS